MKTCTYCGKDYPDEAIACAIDGNPLEAVHPSSPRLEIAAVQQGTVVRAATVSAVILILGLFRIVAIAQGQWSASIFIMVASVLLACVVAIGVVAFSSRRTRTPWSWLRVIVVTLLSYVGFGIFCMTLAVMVASISRALISSHAG